MRNFKLLTTILALGLMFGACKKDEETSADGSKSGAAKGAVVWNGEVDKAVAVNIQDVPSARTNASGEKIPSNAHSAKYPGIYFIWDSKQKDNGYLKVAGYVFEQWESFVLTSKEGNKYFDFPISIQPGQQMTADGGYVFFIPRALNNKNINMVFLEEFVEKIIEEEPVVVNLGFIGWYLDQGGVPRQTSFYWQKLEEGECIDWDAVDAAYAGWVAQGGLTPERQSWKTSGAAPFFFKDHDEKCFGDFNLGQLETYYYAYYVDPGYVLGGDAPLTGNLIINSTFDCNIQVDFVVSGGGNQYTGFMPYTNPIPISQHFNNLGGNNGLMYVQIAIHGVNGSLLTYYPTWDGVNDVVIDYDYDCRP